MSVNPVNNDPRGWKIVWTATGKDFATGFASKLEASKEIAKIARSESRRERSTVAGDNVRARLTAVSA